LLVQQITIFIDVVIYRQLNHAASPIQVILYRQSESTGMLFFNGLRFRVSSRAHNDPKRFVIKSNRRYVPFHNFLLTQVDC